MRARVGRRSADLRFVSKNIRRSTTIASTNPLVSHITPSSFPTSTRRRRRSPGSACSAPPARAPPLARSREGARPTARSTRIPIVKGRAARSTIPTRLAACRRRRSVTGLNGRMTKTRTRQRRFRTGRR